jgi:type VI secretion system secreted protein Hcp
MAFDAFIIIKGIPGESTDDKHAGWIELLSYNFGCSQSGSGQMSATGAHSGGRADFQDFSFSHIASKASPKLMLALANGTHIDEINIELCRATGDKQKFYEYKFTKCMPSGKKTRDCEWK